MELYKETIKMIFDAVPDSQREEDYKSVLYSILSSSVENYSACREEGLINISFSQKEAGFVREYFLTADHENYVIIGCADFKPIYICIKLSTDKFLPIHEDFSGEGFISFYNKSDNQTEETTVMSIDDLEKLILSLK